MSRTNYKALLSDRMEKDFSKWIKQREISEREMYRFLHTMKGTAGTIGLMELSQFCATQLELFAEDSDTLLPVDSLQSLMVALRNHFKEENSSLITKVEVNLQKEIPTNDVFVLVIDSDAELASYIKESLEEHGIQVVIALDGKKGMELFYTLQPQMVILDLQLPDVDGFELISRIYEPAKNQYVPLAIVSSDDRIENQIKAMEIGATDFLSKPLNMALFVPYVLNRLRLQKMILQETLYDELTGAGNRKYFNDVLSQMTTLSEKSKKTFTLVLFDLDHFKKVNDNYGHPIGDEVLQAFSQLLLKKKRDSDYFFRYGGEEFALILPDTAAETAISFVEQTRLDFANIAFTDQSNNSFHVTFSAGISEYRQKQDTLVTKADQALYQAKKNGRNQTMMFEIAAFELKRQLNIIIVDDDSLVRKLISKQFAGWKPDDFDITIEEYADGVSFIESDWYKPEENYMILLDGVMPKMDGLEVLNHVRSQYPNDNIVISMLTSRSNESDIVLALRSGADDYILKPFYAQEVVARVQRLTMRLFK
ncbi:response regulator diguanylate cyclase/phosphodiesterase [Planococcus donghaensis MPA1U2]|uniref:Response regulator diguanylate cyclase/phosphodiesterase n=1 Tax=Planococcus donghaensis MPA1U2 TaxID=933115 RepID=E7RDI8_9BACL|nr:diguanylate cyclase [Planococcus donghaensis]EGA90992.1 response regulator diguanylate cyclase/phosphodiesterase [Planococcus donghaensis MPA1U2]